MNWYKCAKETKPFDIIKICFGKEEKVGEVEAHSSEQARMFALKKNIKDLQSYMEMGCTIVARLNKEKFEQREKASRIEEKLKEEKIQNAWWQD